MLLYNEFDVADAEHDFTMDTTPILREPLYLSPEEDDLYVKGNMWDYGFDFTDATKGEQSWKKAIVANEGWTWYADNRDGDKYGYIADSVSGGQHLAILLSGKEHGKVEISYIVSYENFGIALSWLDEYAENAHKKECSQEVNGTQVNLQQLSAIWQDTASVPKLELLSQNLDFGLNKTLHVCLTPRGKNSTRQGSGNKFKLLGIRVY
jgi:hypothetical protein